MTVLPIRYAPPMQCSRDLEKGEVKRIVSGRVLVGYYVACPACGVVVQITERLVEELPLKSVRVTRRGSTQAVTRPTAVSSWPIPCRGCARTITLRGETVEAAP